jgi:hypothetical protein|tara:strand:- start:490 stop:942 length:453 start_codon:yes stop_codon:yes gene_type:complete
MNELQILVNTFDNYASSNGFVFAHGTRAFTNLKTNEADTNKFLHLYEVDIVPVKQGQLYLNLANFRGTFFLGMKSIISETFYQGNNDPAGLNYRFDKYFVPLYTDMVNFINQLNVCDEFDLTVGNITKRVNYMDANMDGYLIDFTINLDV